MIIAIDGPAASGKGTIGRRMAAFFGLRYLDTGKIYRAVALAAEDAGADLTDEDAVLACIPDAQFDALDHPRLRTAKTGAAASVIAAHGGVRAALLQFQRDFAATPPGAVIDGRDIGTVVCPHAEVKLFVTASLSERAARRAAELRALGSSVTDAQMSEDLAARDARDTSRGAAPMRVARDARLLDTSGMTIDAAFEEARRLVDAVLASKGADA